MRCFLFIFYFFILVYLPRTFLFLWALFVLFYPFTLWWKWTFSRFCIFINWLMPTDCSPRQWWLLFLNIWFSRFLLYLPLFKKLRLLVLRGFQIFRWFFLEFVVRLVLGWSIFLLDWKVNWSTATVFTNLKISLSNA